MGLYGGLVGGVLGVAGSIYGGLKASEAMREAKKGIEAQRQKNQNWYDRRYNEDATQRADAQAILARTEESIRNRNRQAAGTAAVMGGTAEAQQAAQAANNTALANAATNIAVNADARKDTLEQIYLQNDASISNTLNDMEVKRAQAISEAAKGVGQAGAGLAGAF